MTSLNSNPLPPLYAAWFDDLLGREIPPETRATCHDCAMCESGGEYQKPGSKLFNPRSKCCTYQPKLHNFLTGLILSDDDPAMVAGRASVIARLQAGVAVTPLGLGKSPKFKLLYDQMEMRGFGRAQSLRCSHYRDEQGGLCGVWKYRNGICSTWFCKYERGAVGRDFWIAAEYLLVAIEEDLARWCVIELEVGEEALEILFEPPSNKQSLALEDLDDQVEPGKQRRVWGHWYGREDEFYRECARLVSPLSWQEVLTLCGPEVRGRAQLTQKAYRAASSQDVPARLQLGAFTVIEAGADFFRVYRPDMGLDTFTLSAKIMRLLPFFDGRPTAEVVAQISEKERLRFTDELLRRLVDFRILVAVEG